ncbi:MAG: UDP-N-acetylmuramate--L-alanine ligase, partial [Candidatus Eremiobacteraeota bacterium]|nr:UDP-N-acetylmuramate--L-alanine ligase [Candidatus Eremiobacteraeota bacterium]
AMLAEIAKGHKLVAVAGTHGKTTTTAMLAAIFERAGLDPTVLVGGIPTGAVSNARAGGSEWFVSEADESDHSFLELTPSIAIVTNIENDHIASDAELPRLLASFETFAANTQRGGTIAIGTDNPCSADLARRLRSTAWTPVVDATPDPHPAPTGVATFAVHGPADITVRDVAYADLASHFTVIEHGTALGEIALHVPGEMNVANALAAVAAARAAGIPVAPIAAALEAFRGVGRRFEIVAREPFTVVDDYAHHPTAIAQTIAAARTAAHGRPLIVAFQPHRYTRTAYLKDDFARALQGADRVYLTPVYAASEAPIPGVDERSIGEPLAAAGTPVTYVAQVEELAERFPRETPDGALLLMLGAGSISQVAHALGERLDAALA